MSPLVQRVHERLLASVLGLPLAFFDATPPGRILNRFSSDTGVGCWVGCPDWRVAFGGWTWTCFCAPTCALLDLNLRCRLTARTSCNTPYPSDTRSHCGRLPALHSQHPAGLLRQPGGRGSRPVPHAGKARGACDGAVLCRFIYPWAAGVRDARHAGSPSPNTCLCAPHPPSTCSPWCWRCCRRSPLPIASSSGTIGAALAALLCTRAAVYCVCPNSKALHIDAVAASA